ncbi:sensor protein KdpD [Picosynechococcus sp. NKBG15041c]|uniref:sensor protein KdpD n=1 Tax=Picosynechococcus sp. NKBG15041c TaxID=1407650 RepID=UPI00041ED932|nr:universal stress protein [Picosynechococcus sp. NKBG15041c]
MYNPTAIAATNYQTLPRRGKHKIFIGMAPGVGKTYRMLEEGHALKQDGFDVVIGLLEAHGREETTLKAEGLELIPRKQVYCRNVLLQEMDTEEILRRSPQLVLIDELAHTNIPGSKQEKRYQDVEKILDAGIDVYSTVNIQHLESLNDLVYRISGVVVRERVPDRIIDDADEIVVVDVTPETLQERLQEGKIYAPEKIDQALQNFFRRSNLIALRELALREIADNLEEESASAAKNLHYNIRERVLVCISTYPNSIQLLRRGARIANHMNGQLFVLFVAPAGKFLSKPEALHIETCKRLCEEFSGKFIRIESSNIVTTIIKIALQERITQIVLGETRRSRFQLLFKGSIVQRLVRLLPQVDLHIIANSSNLTN